MKTLSQIEVNVAFALCAGTITVTPHTTVTGNIHTAINDEHGVIVTFPTNQEAQEFVNRVYDQFVTTAQSVGCYQHR